MTECIDAGLLRAYLDPLGMSPQDRHAVEMHLPGCPACREQLAQLRSISAHTDTKLQALAPTAAEMPTSKAAWECMLERLAAEQPVSVTSTQHTPAKSPSPEKPSVATQQRRNSVQLTANSRLGPRRAALTGLAALVAISLVVFPPFRAAAETFLQTFRANSVIFVPTDTQSRISALQDAQFNPETLFISSPQLVNGMSHTHVDTVATAAQNVGFTPAQIDASSLPDKLSLQEIQVWGSGNVTFTVNVPAIRSVLNTFNIQDVTIPDALGAAPVNAFIPPAMEIAYNGPNYRLMLMQAKSPTLDLPAGVDISQLGRAALRVYGMNSADADALSKQIDWSSTLVVPFPTDLKNVQQVDINGVQGMLVEAGQVQSITMGKAPTGVAQTLLYWQRGERIYVLAGDGNVTTNQLITAARSVQ